MTVEYHPACSKSWREFGTITMRKHQGLTCPSVLSRLRDYPKPPLIMKRHRLTLSIAIALSVVSAEAQQIVGYVSEVFAAGDNLFQNAFQNPNNFLSSLITSAPVGTTVSLWKTSANVWSPVSLYDG